MKILPISILGLALVAFVNSASAITVTNFSFESPTVASNPGYESFSSVPGWVFGGSSDFSGLQLISTQYSSPNPANSEGSQDAVFNLSAGTTLADAATITYATSGDSAGNGATLGPILANTNYTLTVALGNRMETDPSTTGTPGDIYLRLLAGTGADSTTYSIVEQVEVTASQMPNDAFTDFQVSLTAAEIQSLSLLGDNLGIQLAATNPYSYEAQDNFDNVRLTSLAVPEPRTWALMGFGGLALLVALNRMKNRA